MFENRMIRFAEVGSEVSMLIASIFILELIRNDVSNEVTTQLLNVLILTSIGILILINLSNMIWNILDFFLNVSYQPYQGIVTQQAKVQDQEVL